MFALAESYFNPRITKHRGRGPEFEHRYAIKADCGYEIASPATHFS